MSASEVEQDELAEMVCQFTEEGMRLQRMPWMTDSQWTFVKAKFSASWETYVESLVEHQAAR